MASIKDILIGAALIGGGAVASFVGGECFRKKNDNAEDDDDWDDYETDNKEEGSSKES